MSQNYYQLYIDSVFKLASTIVIKSDYSADSVNNLLIYTYGNSAVDPYDKTTWKYYLNLNGQYHLKDQKIYITSLDNLEKITFDRITLQDHPATLEAYEYGSRYYNELITLYPLMEQFILGCLYPVDLAQAIAADDGTVLSYPSDLIEVNEESLIENINAWIKQYRFRWSNDQFNVTDSLYSAANLGIMYLNLIPLILNLRLQACKTKEAHSYHIREYLASHGFLDRYIDFLNLKQKLFLYRNIRYIHRNAGKRETFAWLIDRLLTERRIPIAEDTMKHDVSGLDNSYYSKIGFRRKNLNDVYSPITKTVPVIDLDELLYREELLAPGNAEFSADARNLILEKFENSKSSVVVTKVLESAMVDYSDSEVYTLTEARLSNWLLYSSLNKYNAFISFKEPVTSAEKTLSAFDAYIYWFYCYCKSLDINLVDIPELFVKRAVYPDPVSFQDLENIVETAFVTDELINSVLNTHINIPVINSVGSFHSVIENIYSTYLLQLRIQSNVEHFHTHGLTKNMVNRLYFNKLLDTKGLLLDKNGVELNTFSEWLSYKGLSNIDYTDAQFKDLHLDIFESATGASFHTTKELGDLQRALLALIGELSSYSIQILSEINELSIVNVGNSAIRLGDFNSIENSLHEILISDITPHDFTYTVDDLVQIPVIPGASNIVITPIVDEEPFIEIAVKASLEFVYYYNINIGKISVNPCYGDDPNFVGGVKILDSYQEFYNLSPEDQASVRDVYYDVFPVDTTIGKANLNIVLFNNVLNSFEKLTINNQHLDSFDYKYIPTMTINGIKIAYTASIEAFKANIGSTKLNAFKLFNQVKVLDIFKYYAGIEIFNGFTSNFNATNGYPHYLHTAMNLGEDIAFAIPNFGTGAFNLYSLPGQSADGFYLVSGEGNANYKLVGYRYNGERTIWS